MCNNFVKHKWSIAEFLLSTKFVKLVNPSVRVANKMQNLVMRCGRYTILLLYYLSPEANNIAKKL